MPWKEILRTTALGYLAGESTPQSGTFGFAPRIAHEQSNHEKEATHARGNSIAESSGSTQVTDRLSSVCSQAEGHTQLTWRSATRKLSIRNSDQSSRHSNQSSPFRNTSMQQD